MNDLEQMPLTRITLREKAGVAFWGDGGGMRFAVNGSDSVGDPSFAGECGMLVQEPILATGNPVASLTQPASSRTKRCLDVAGALFGLLLFLPFLALIALAIRLESSGPVIFRQRRGGLHGRPFTIYKFRTMRALDDGETIQQVCPGDPRVTPLGAVLRRTSIDELPQLMNVLRGDMSLVGPRPHALAHDRFYGQLIPQYSERLRTRPGLTGLAQVAGLRGETRELNEMAERVKHDVRYIEEWSLLLDLQLLGGTVRALRSSRAC